MCVHINVCVCVYQIATVYTLDLHNVICQLHPWKAGKTMIPEVSCRYVKHFFFMRSLPSLSDLVSSFGLACLIWKMWEIMALLFAHDMVVERGELYFLCFHPVSFSPET